MNYGKEGVDYLSVAISAIDDSDAIKPVAECFVAEKYSWVEPVFGISQHDCFPPGEGE